MESSCLEDGCLQRHFALGLSLVWVEGVAFGGRLMAFIVLGE